MGSSSSSSFLEGFFQFLSATWLLSMASYSGANKHDHDHHDDSSKASHVHMPLILFKIVCQYVNMKNQSNASSSWKQGAGEALRSLEYLQLTCH